MNRSYVIGVDFGTDSCRVLIADAANGEEIATSVKHYPRWKKGLYCDPSKNQYRQHPLDYVEALTSSVKEAIAIAPEDVRLNIIGISFDMTGSTPVLINEEGTPLALLEEFKDNPNAMFVLWKDHTAIQESLEINKLAKEWDIDYTMYEGGIYSAEWVWSKVLHILRNDEKIRKAAYSWVEHTDWIPALLTGTTKPEIIIRSRCAAGHKAMWHESWDGLPSQEFLNKLSPLLEGFRERLFEKTYPSDKKVGNLTAEWAQTLGLPANIAIGVGAIDCHMGAVGAGIKPGTFVRVMGTSTCDVMVVPHNDMQNKFIPGICGQVDGSVIPNMIGLEAGQSAYGDIFAWFRNILKWPLTYILPQSELIDENTKSIISEEIIDKIIPALSEEASRIDIHKSTLIATDWLNGRRTPDANQLLQGSIAGLTLGTSAPLIFRALVEAAAFGSKAIVDRFIENEIDIQEIIAIGGITQKSPFVMQILADVLGLPIKVAQSEQACALGAAMFAAVVSGKYNNIENAQKAMEQGFTSEYIPDKMNHAIYQERYKKYLMMGEFSHSLL